MPCFASPLALFVALAVGTAGAVSESGFETFRTAIDACYRQQYDSAAAPVSLILAEDPGDMAGLFWQASLTQLLIYDTGRPAMIDSFYRLSDRAAAACRVRLKAAPQDARAHLYLGMTELNRANVQSWQQNRTRALRTMLSVQPEMRAALKQQPGLVDAYFGLGMVEFFRAQGNRFLLGLSILGSKSKAYDWMGRVVRDSSLFQPAAQFSLAWMLGQDRRFDEALEQCELLLERYPGNRTIMRVMRDVCFDMGDYEQVVTIGREMEKSVLASFPDNRYYLSENRLKVARAWNGLNQPDSVRVYARQIIDWEEYQDEVPWLPNYVREAKELVARLDR